MAMGARAIRGTEPLGGTSGNVDAGALLWALRRVAQIAALEGPLESVLQETLAPLCGAGGFAAGNVLLSPRPKLLQGRGVFHGNELLRSAASEVELSAGQALAGCALERKSVAWGSDFSGDPRAGALSALGIRSAVACPILLGNDVAGAIELFSVSPECPDPLVTAAVEQAAALLGHAVERDRFRAVFERAGVGLALGMADERARERARR